MASVDWPGILIGGAITFLVSLIFYLPSAISLKRESARLRRHTTLILRGLEEAGLVEYNRDQQGEIVGMVINLSGVVSGGGSASATLTVGDEDNGPPPIRNKAHSPGPNETTSATGGGSSGATLEYYLHPRSIWSTKQRRPCLGRMGRTGTALKSIEIVVDQRGFPHAKL